MISGYVEYTTSLPWSFAVKYTPIEVQDSTSGRRDNFETGLIL